jgi:hypothetical protein
MNVSGVHNALRFRQVQIIPTHRQFGTSGRYMQQWQPGSGAQGRLTDLINGTPTL